MEIHGHVLENLIMKGDAIGNRTSKCKKWLILMHKVELPTYWVFIFLKAAKNVRTTHLKIAWFRNLILINKDHCPAKKEKLDLCGFYCLLVTYLPKLPRISIYKRLNGSCFLFIAIPFYKNKRAYPKYAFFNTSFWSQPVLVPLCKFYTHN